VLACG